AFSGNGRRLASSASDNTAVVWDLSAAPGGMRGGRPGEKELAGWWAGLAGADAGWAWAAVWRVADAPGSAGCLGRHLKPGTAEARGLLESLAAGAPGAWLTGEARIACRKR